MRPYRRLYPIAYATLVIAWIVYMTAGGFWELYHEFWQAALTMVFGSFVAGSTPAGGGAVAFPVFTKVLGVDAATSRTHALMIQSVGMTMATIFILTRGIPIYRRVLKWACLGGTIGMTCGTLFVHLPAPYPKILFTSVVFAFGMNFAISRWFLKLGHRVELPVWGPRDRLNFVFAGLVGGLVASIAGSGIDLICFILMTLGYGLTERRAIPTSVVIMASMSVLGFLLHGVVERDIEAATPYWLVSVPIVAAGAPLGAWVASHIPHHLLIAGIMLLVVVETASTIWIVMLDQKGPQAWLVAGATVVFTALAFAAMLRRRVSREKAGSRRCRSSD